MDLFESEHVVADMLVKADAITAEVMARFSISHVIAAFSGGDDSVVSTHWAMNKFPDAVVMIGDTQVGLQPTRDHQSAVVKACGWDYHRVAPSPEGKPKGWGKEWIEGSTSYEEFVLNFGFPGNAQHARMYQRLKQRAFRKIKDCVPGGRSRPRGSRMMVVSGIRADESAIRAGYQRAWQEEPSECFVWVNPFYYSTATEFEAYRQEFGLPLNPVKKLCGVSGECCCGSHVVPGERAAYSVADPLFSFYLDELESRVMQRFDWGFEGKPPAMTRREKDERNGQTFLDFDSPAPTFMPACVGCIRKR